VRARLSHLGLGAAALASLLSFGQTSSAEPYALFWSRGHTWLMDAGDGSLYRAPKLYAEGPGGVLFEYRLETHSAPSGGAASPEAITSSQPERPFGWLYRWMSFERYLLGDTSLKPAQRGEARGGEGDEGARAVSTTLTSHYSPEQVEGDFSDEHQVLQFTGERVTLARWVSQRKGEERRASRSLYTIDLANRQTLSQLDEGPSLARLTRGLFPQLIPSCLGATSALLSWELAAQRSASWLLLMPRDGASVSPSCPASGALRVKAPESPVSAGSLSWDPQRGQLLDLGEPILGGVVDTLLHPSGDMALILEGPTRRGEEGLFVSNPLALDEPEHSRSLSLWRRRGSPKLVSLPHLLELQRLDGARWLKPDHPLLQLLKTHFSNIESEGCYQQLKSHRVERYHRPPRPELSAHICRVETYGRLWGGVEDLSASAFAAQDETTLFLELWVRDPQRTRGDLVTLWLGEASAPIELKVRRRQILGPPEVTEQLLMRWVEGPALKTEGEARLSQRAQQSTLIEREADSGPPAGGYLVSFELPLSLVKGGLSVMVQDVDVKQGSERVQLWVVGEPSRGYDAVIPARIGVE